MGNEEEIIVEPGKVNIQERNLLLIPDSDEVCLLTNEVLPVYRTYRQKLKNYIKNMQTACLVTMRNIP